MDRRMERLVAAVQEALIALDMDEVDEAEEILANVLTEVLVQDMREVAVPV